MLRVHCSALALRLRYCAAADERSRAALQLLESSSDMFVIGNGARRRRAQPRRLAVLRLTPSLVARWLLQAT